MTTMASQITSLTVVYSTVYSDADQRKHQSSASLAFVRGIHRDRWIPGTKASYAENVFIWWRHHDISFMGFHHNVHTRSITRFSEISSAILNDVILSNMVVWNHHKPKEFHRRHALFCRQHSASLHWRHNEHEGVSNHQPHGCLLNRLSGCRSKKTSKLRVTGLCAGNSPETGEFPAQIASNAENVSIWWRHLVLMKLGHLRQQ